MAYYRYLVEGECEEKFINDFKNAKNKKFISGKVEVFNILYENISITRLINFHAGTILILIYDTDKGITNIFLDNIVKLKSNKNIKQIIHIQSVNNFEDEIVYVSNLKNISEMFNTQGREEFKRKFISSHIIHKLKSINFDFKLLWTRQDKCFKSYPNQSKFIKI